MKLAHGLLHFVFRNGVKYYIYNQYIFIKPFTNTFFLVLMDLKILLCAVCVHYNR